MRSDSLQVSEIVSAEPVMYKKVGHHGPAVENAYYALRIYFNDSGAIDLYSKSGARMELLRYLWYPSAEQQAAEAAGCDEYLVGKTVGLGGIALWDEGKEVKLTASARTARVGKTRKGSFAEMISYGVPYQGDTVDICVRVDMHDRRREASITAWELNGRKVRFFTGVNYHPGASVLQVSKTFCNSIAVWGVHPADVSQNPTPIGAGMRYNKKIFPQEGKCEGQSGNMLYVVSRPCSRVRTRVFAASSKEKELGDCDKFFSYVR